MIFKIPKKIFWTIFAVTMFLFAWVMGGRLWMKYYIPPKVQRSNVIIFVVEGLRPDYLGCYGFKGNISPNINNFARGAVLYKNAYSAAPWTLPSMASLFTSAPPFVHQTYRSVPLAKEIAKRNPEAGRKKLGQTGKTFFGLFNDIATAVLSTRWPTLAESLTVGNYTTAMASSQTQDLSHLSGLYQGFHKVIKLNDRNWQKFKKLKPSPAPTALAQAALDWYKKKPKNKPYFLVMHFNNLRAPYEASDEKIKFMEKFPGIRPSRPLTKKEMAFLPGRIRAGVKAHPALPIDDRRSYQLLYAASVRTFDEEFGKVLQLFNKNGMMRNTIVVFTSDHGEELMEHGRWGHGHSLYNQQIKVPLIIRFPDRYKRGQRVSDLASLMDVAPTIVAATGNARPTVWQGIDLRKRVWPWKKRKAVLAGGVEAYPNRVAAIGSQYKIILEPFNIPIRPANYISKVRKWPLPDPKFGVVYDLKKQPGENTSLVNPSPSITQPLIQEINRSLKKRLPKVPPPTAPGAQAPVPPTAK